MRGIVASANIGLRSTARMWPNGYSNELYGRKRMVSEE